MPNIWDNHINNNHPKSQNGIQIGSIINTTLGKAKILDINGPTFGVNYTTNTPNRAVLTLTLSLIETQQVFQTNVSTQYFGSGGTSPDGQSVEIV